MLSSSGETRAPFQYPVGRLTVRSRKVSKPRDLYLELSDRSEIWQAPRQQGCQSACQISRRCDNLNYQSRDFETSRDLTIRCLIGYWNGAQDSKLGVSDTHTRQQTEYLITSRLSYRGSSKRVFELDSPSIYVYIYILFKLQHVITNLITSCCNFITWFIVYAKRSMTW